MTEAAVAASAPDWAAASTQGFRAKGCGARESAGAGEALRAGQRQNIGFRRRSGLSRGQVNGVKEDMTLSYLDNHSLGCEGT